MAGYYKESFTVSRCLEKEKEKNSLEDFKYSFYRKLKLNGMKYSENQYDEFLETLYNAGAYQYHECYVTMVRMPLKYLRDNQYLIANLIKSNNTNLIQVAYDMYKKRGSIVTRLLPARANRVTVKESDEQILCELGNLLLSIKNEEENAIAKAQIEFSNACSQYKNNEYLKEYYNEMFDSIEQEFLKTISNEINSVGSIKKILEEQTITNASFDDRQLFEKMKKNKEQRPNMFKQTFK